ncbi:hypothetical protein DPX16_3394 [Anabarilius grahami]|uniref:Uncharacterized protein n=1 Tax=Anabarilius grahami TaxID=495550 RepID=A0A3N0XLH4_ANAGA|nr:hypothetical protein DPX16_3394 [Anabarilius grahami]
MFVCSREFCDECFVNKSQFGTGFADRGCCLSDKGQERRPSRRVASLTRSDPRYLADEFVLTPSQPTSRSILTAQTAPFPLLTILWGPWMVH